MFPYPLDYLSIFITALIGTAVTSLWYSPTVFGRLWMTDTEKIHTEDFVRVVHRTWMSLALYFVFFTLISLVIEMARDLQIPVQYCIITIMLLLLSYIGERYVREGRTVWYIALFSLYTVGIVIGGALIVAFWPW